MYFQQLVLRTIFIVQNTFYARCSEVVLELQIRDVVVMCWFSIVQSFPPIPWCGCYSISCAAVEKTPRHF